MNNQSDSKTLAERLFAKSYEKFVDEIPSTMKRGLVMKLTLEKFKKNLEVDSAREMDSYLKRFEAMCEQLSHAKADQEKLLDRLQEKKIENEELNQKNATWYHKFEEAMRDLNLAKSEAEFHKKVASELRVELQLAKIKKEPVVSDEEDYEDDCPVPDGPLFPFITIKYE